MNWSYKFAFDEIEDVYANYPWIKVEDEIVKKQNEVNEEGESFISMQKKLMLARGWDWFKRAVRGRFFPQFNLTTVTTLEGEREPSSEEENALMISQIRQKFPNTAIYSFVGQKGIVPDTEQYLKRQITPEDLTAIHKVAKQYKWNTGFERISSVQKQADIVTKWKNFAKGFGISMSIGMVGLMGLMEWVENNAVTLEEQSVSYPSIPPEKILADNIPETLQNPSPESEVVDQQPQVVDNVVESQQVDVVALVEKLIQVESSGNPNALSDKGARGIMQIMPDTWKEWSEKVFGQELSIDEAYDPVKNRQVGVAYLQWIQNTLRTWMGQEPGVEHILAAYNGGIGRLRKVNYDISRMPEESRNYVQKNIQGSSENKWNYRYS